MLIVDVNVMLAAHRGDHPDHLLVRDWFETMITGAERFAVPAFVWASFLRLATNRRVFPVPTPIADAFAFIDAVRSQPTYLTADPGPNHLGLLRRMCDEAAASGDLVPDAVLAAVAIEYGAEIVTFDRDFARFPSVRHRRPSPS